MFFLRSFAFNAYLYLLTAVMGVVCAPALVLSARLSLQSIKLWSSFVLWGLKRIVGTEFEIRGAEHLPRGAALIAAKHQSMWETVAVFKLLDKPAVVLKKELSYIPLYGWFAVRARMIVVDRGAHAKALKSMVAKARDRLHAGMQVVIFPEGTRAPPGGKLAYKPGVAALYHQLAVPCVPMALNSGVFWPRRRFLRRPGTIVVEFLPAIAPGLKRRAFMSELESRLETAAAALYADGMAQTSHVAPAAGNDRRQRQSA